MHRKALKQEASQSAETLNDGLVIPSLDLTENVLSTSNIEELANVVEPSFQSQVEQVSTSVFVVEHPLTSKLEQKSTYKSRTNVRNPVF